LKVAVVGGGISGLAAAWELREAADATLFEPGPLGGCIRTTPFNGKPIDEGADSFITRVPEAVNLCRQLGIESELVAPSAGRTLLWWNGRLRRIPDGLVLGVPSQLPSLVTSGILSPRGLARAALDLVLPSRRSPDGLTVRELVAERFGYEVADRLVDPLVGSIHAGWTGQLGAAEVVPQLVAAAEQSRSLMRALRRNGTAFGEPLFLAPQMGMGRLVSKLVDRLNKSGTTFVPHAVHSIQASDSGIVVEPMGECFDAMVLATPARAAGEVLGKACPDVKSQLTQVPTASVALVTVAIRGIDLPREVNGFLVPRETGGLLTACSFGSNKWPHWAGADHSVVRLSTGRYGDEAALELDDEELSGRLIEELSEAVGSTVIPVDVRVSRWSNTFPQYLPGHATTIARVEKSLERQLPVMALGGSSYGGIGIPACIASGKSAARLALHRAKSLAK